MARNPAPEQPIRTYPSPDIADQVVLEWVTSELSASAPVAPGTAHPNTRDFSGFKLGKQVVNPQDHNFFIRYYVKDQPIPDGFTPAWNYALKYSGQSNSHPVVIRAYRNLKNGYTPLAKGTALADFPGAFLIEEEAAQFPTDSEFFALYFNVVRVYETLPGPWIYDLRDDDDLGFVQIKKRAVLVTNPPQTGASSATGKTVYLARENSAIVAWEVIETWSDGSGSAGNPAYPTQTSTDFEKDGIEKITTKQLMPVGNVVTDEDLSLGTLTRKFKEAYPDNPALAFQIIETITVSDTSLLDLPSFTTSILNLIPEIFRGQIPLHVRSHIVPGTAAETALTTGEFEHSERQLTPLYMEVRSTVLDSIGSLPITISGIKETNDKKQVVSVGMKLCVDSTTPTVPTALIDVDFKKLGNGLAVEITKTIPSVFDSMVFEKRRDDTVPERFKATVPAITTKHVLSGTASAPTLTTGDLYRREAQIDAFTYELTITNRDIASLPTLEGQKYDEELNILIPYTEQVVAAGSALGDPSTEVTPLGGGLDLVTVYDLSAIASAFAAFQLVFPGKANIPLPDVLSDLELINEEHSGMGDSSSPYFSAGWSGSGSWTDNPTATAQGSQAVMPELIPTIEPTNGNKKNTTRMVFLLPMPITTSDVLTKIAAILGSSVTDWPDFNPRPVHAVLTGRQISLQVRAAYHVHDGGSATSSESSEGFVRGYSTEVGMVVKTKEIGETIHGDLSADLAPYIIASFDLTADAYYDSETQTTPELSTGVEVRGAGATPGQTTIPSSGKHLLDDNANVYRYNHAMVHAEVFDFADL